MNKKQAQTCPCGGKSYAACCELIHQSLSASSAEALMRSRYSAYVMKLEDYLLATWYPETRPAMLDLADDKSKWLGLQVKHHEESADTAIVEFVARYKIAGRAHRLHEISRFVRKDGRWFYVDGMFPQ